MSQSGITVLCGLVLVAALFASYLKSKRQGNENSSSASPSVKETMKEVSSYFGIETDTESGIGKALDLAPWQMAQAMTSTGQRKPCEGRKGRKKRQ